MVEKEKKKTLWRLPGGWNPGKQRKQMMFLGSCLRYHTSALPLYGRLFSEKFLYPCLNKFKNYRGECKTTETNSQSHSPELLPPHDLPGTFYFSGSSPSGFSKQKAEAVVAPLCSKLPATAPMSEATGWVDKMRNKNNAVLPNILGSQFLPELFQFHRAGYSHLRS